MVKFEKYSQGLYTLSNFFSKCLDHQNVFYRALAAKRIGFCLITTGLFVWLVLKNINRQFEFY